MNNSKREQQLRKIWNDIWHIPGWIRILEMSGDYSQEDITILEGIEGEVMGCEKDAEEYYFRTELPRVKRKIKAFNEEITKQGDQGWVKERRLEFLDQKIESLQKILKEIWSVWEDSIKKDVPWWLRRAVLDINNPHRFERERRKFTMEKYLLENPQELGRGNWVGPQEITRALDHPFENLIELRKGFAMCPFHEEKRSSFYVKNNWGYCFGCQWHGDTIKFLQEKNKLSFQDAVRALQ